MSTVVGSVHTFLDFRDERMDMKHIISHAENDIMADKYLINKELTTMLSLVLVQMREALAQVPYIVHINNQDDYERALELMDELVDDYDTNKQS